MTRRTDIHLLPAPAAATPGRAARSNRPARGFRVTERDRALLTFIAAHRFVLACHARAFLDADRAVAYRRLTGLTDVGLLSYRRIFHAQPGVFAVTNGGLAVIDSPLPRPAVDLRTYRHDIGAAWLWLVARAGRFGSVEQVWSERELRSLAHRRDRESAYPLVGLPLDTLDRAGRPQLHLPDVLAVVGPGAGTALELELSMKARGRLEDILLAYSACAWADRVIYLTDRRHIARALGEIVASFALDALVSVVYLPESESDPQWWLWRSITDRRGGAR